jgi:Putative Actinobacterial Holin-X, holin superfamily III
MTAANSENREQSIAQLFRELSQETGQLVRDELHSVRDELTEQGKRVGASAGLLGAAGVLGAGAFGALTAGLVAALGRGSTVRGAFAVTALYGGGATALAMIARDRLREVAPEVGETAEGVRRDVEAATAGVRDGA